MNHLRFIIVIIGIVLGIIPMLLFLCIARLLRLRLADKIPQLFYKFLLKLLGIHTHISGYLKQNVPLILVSNHISWLDIIVIGASFPCYFIAKSDIAGWPVLGFLARMQNTVFVNRKARGSAIEGQVNDITKVLKQNKIIVLFPEATTSDGNKTLRFKSALLAAAKAGDNYKPYVQPLCLRYQAIAGMPIHRRQRPFVAWYGDADLVPHIQLVLQQSPIHVHIQLGESLVYENFESRQKMAEYLENSIRSAYTQVRNG